MKFILTADWHLRLDTPICRTDDYLDSVEKKLLFIKKMKMNILHAGDLFHHWKPSPELLVWTMRHIPENILLVAGNHDLPQHNAELIDKCGVGVLYESRKIELTRMCDLFQNNSEDVIISASWWNDDLPEISKHFTDYKCVKIALLHKMTWHKDLPYPGCDADSAKKLMRKLKNFDLIVTGDNHKTFVVEKDGQILVNPGSLTRMTSEQSEHRPCVFVYDTEKKSLEQVFLPITEDAVTRVYGNKQSQRQSKRNCVSMC